MNRQAPPPKPFTWSWSRLKNYRTCPRRQNEIDYKKAFKETKGAALSWGDEFHKHMADRLIFQKMLPPAMREHEPLARSVELTCNDYGVAPRVELKVACTREMKPCGYWDRDVWVRANIDVLVVLPHAAQCIDWKTGKIESDTQQLALNAAMVFATYPNLYMVKTEYVWIAHRDDKGEVPRTTEYFTSGPSRYETLMGEETAVQSLASMWNSIVPDLRAMETSWMTGDYPPNPCGLCVKYCPVKTCEYYGVGSR